MASQELPKMSLVAQYDDLRRYTKVLTSGLEEEFKFFVENQLNCVRKWKKTDVEAKMLRGRITNLESKHGRLKGKIRHLKNLLEDAKAAKRKIELEKKCLESTITAVRDIILSGKPIDNQTKEKIEFLNSTYIPSFNSSTHLETIEESVGSLLSLSETDKTDDDNDDYNDDCDDTEEGIKRFSDRQSRRSKMKRCSFESMISLEEKKTDELVELLNQVSRKVHQQNSNEAISTCSGISAVSQQAYKLDSPQSRFNTCDYKYDPDSTPVSNQASLKYMRRNHQLVSKKVIKSVKCLGCKQTIGCLKQSLKCQSCNITFHPQCKNACPKLCFPVTNTPAKGTAGTIADYTSSSSPMIPPLIVHCVREIESRGMEEIGLYRISSSERDVNSLIDKFVSDRIIPCLDDVNIHTLCVAVKEFLRSLSEPLITHKSWREFVAAANLEDAVESSYALLGLVSDLPQPNRDTLSFLILHWKKIVESAHYKMDIEILSKILGPVVVGCSTSGRTRANTHEEATNQYQVMKLLLSISSASWQSLLSVAMCQSLEEIPVNTTPKGRLLGPVYAFVQESKNSVLRKTPFTPRN